MQIKKNQVKKNHHVREEASEEAQNWFVHKNLKSKKSAIQVRSGVYPERWPWIFHGDHEFWIIYSFTFIQSARTLFQMANYSSAESVIRKCCGLLMNRNNCAFSRHQMFPCCYSERLIGLYRSTAIHKIQQTNLCQRIVFVRVRLSYVKKSILSLFFSLIPRKDINLIMFIGTIFMKVFFPRAVSYIVSEDCSRWKWQQRANERKKQISFSSHYAVA